MFWSGTLLRRFSSARETCETTQNVWRSSLVNMLPVVRAQPLSALSVVQDRKNLNVLRKISPGFGLVHQ